MQVLGTHRDGAFEVAPIDPVGLPSALDVGDLDERDALAGRARIDIEGEQSGELVAFIFAAAEHDGNDRVALPIIGDRAAADEGVQRAGDVTRGHARPPGANF